MPGAVERRLELPSRAELAAFWPRLWERALEAARKAHAPYSQFFVGAAVLASDGQIYSGCNIENAAYPAGLCAERVALSGMHMAGAGPALVLTVLALQRRGSGEEVVAASPCGICRQFLAELGTAETWVLLPDLAHSDAGLPAAAMPHFKAYRLGELLPLAFAATALDQGR